jgi:hypothetical protein
MIEPCPCDKRYIGRESTGEFRERQVDVGRSLSQDKEEHGYAHHSEKDSAIAADGTVNKAKRPPLNTVEQPHVATALLMEVMSRNAPNRHLNEGDVGLQRYRIFKRPGKPIYGCCDSPTPC